MSRLFKIYGGVTMVLFGFAGARSFELYDKLTREELIINSLVIPITWPIAFPLALGCAYFGIEGPLKFDERPQTGLILTRRQ